MPKNARHTDCANSSVQTQGTTGEADHQGCWVPCQAAGLSACRQQESLEGQNGQALTCRGCQKQPRRKEQETWRTAANSKERGDGGGKKLEAVGNGRAPPGLETSGRVAGHCRTDLPDTPETQPNPGSGLRSRALLCW